MNKIEFPRVGYDGISRSQDRIESWFCGEIENAIEQRLDVIQIETQWSRDEKACSQSIKNQLHSILLANPRRLLELKDAILTNYPGLFANKKRGSFNKRIH